MKRLMLSAVIGLSASMAQAIDYSAALTSFVQSDVAAWAQDPALVDAIRAQNARHAGLDANAITALDLKWRAEIGQGDTPTITPVLDHPASDALRGFVADSGGMVTEIFVMDEHGLNVAASAVTSDYWQGDEAKFQETYGKGPGSIHLSEIEFDESSQTYQAQVSMPIVDPDSGTVIGAVTVGVNADALM